MIMTMIMSVVAIVAATPAIMSMIATTSKAAGVRVARAMVECMIVILTGAAGARAARGITALIMMRAIMLAIRIAGAEAIKATAGCITAITSRTAGAAVA